MKRYAAIILGIMGLLFTASSIYLVYDALSFRGRAARAAGTVIGLVSHSSVSRSSSTKSFYPLVEFTTREGRRIEFESSSGSNPPSYTVGEKVPVLYDPKDLSDARIYSSDFMFWLLPGVFSILSLILDGLAIMLYAMHRRDGYSDPFGHHWPARSLN